MLGSVTSERNAPWRNPVTDHLLTPQNAALVVIDFQPSQIESVRSIEHDVLVDNIVSVTRLATTSNFPWCCRPSTSATARGRRFLS